MSGWIDRSGWIHCPTCGNKTRTKVNPDTVVRARRQDAEPMICRVTLRVVGFFLCCLVRDR